MLRRVRFLRSGLYLAIELRKSTTEGRRTSREAVERDFHRQVDPFQYTTNPVEKARFRAQQELLDRVRKGERFGRVLEIGSAEGVFTEVVADRCESLLVLDISPTALARTRARREWTNTVELREWDLLRDPLPGTFDLIVVTGVLEYFSRRRTFRMARTKLVSGLNPGGYFLLESTRANPVVERAWWGRGLVRGKWINRFFEQEPSLTALRTITDDHYVITLFRKTGGAEAALPTLTLVRSQQSALQQPDQAVDAR